MNYITQLPWGRDVKSTTLILRDNRNKVYGAFCLNLDITEVRNAAAFLSGISGQTAPVQAPATFTDDIREVIDVVLSQELKDQHFDELSPKQRVALFRILDEKGIFGIRKGISRLPNSSEFPEPRRIHIWIVRGNRVLGSRSEGMLDLIRAMASPTQFAISSAMR